MRSFDYSRLYEKAWDTDILNLVAKIHECKGRQDLFIRQKPVELSKIQAQRFWLVDDREAYKVALAAQLFHARLSQAVEEDTKCGMHR